MTAACPVLDPQLVPLDVFESMVVDGRDALPESVAAVVPEAVVLVRDRPEPDGSADGVPLLGL